MGLGVTLRRAELEDMDYIQTLLEVNDLPVANLDEVLDCLYIRETDGRRTGVGGSEQYQDVALPRSVAIEEAARGMGYGKEICNKLLNRTQGRGITDIFLITITAEGSLVQLGFEQIDRESVSEFIQETRDFSDLCPSTAVCMKRKIDSLDADGLPGE